MKNARRVAPSRRATVDPAAAPLLVLCALAPERWALRGGDWSGSTGRESSGPGSAGHALGEAPPVLAATGMGGRRAKDAVDSLLAGGGYGTMLVAGFGASVRPGIRPGDAIVANEVCDDAGTLIEVPSCDVLADALRTIGLNVHVGRLHSADRVVRGRVARERLHAGGAVGIDMETAAALGAARCIASGLPLAAVRIVVDTPESELLRPGTARSGVRAWRALRSAVPAFTAWHAASREMAHSVGLTADQGPAAADVTDRAGAERGPGATHTSNSTHTPDSSVGTLPQEAS